MPTQIHDKNVDTCHIPTTVGKFPPVTIFLDLFLCAGYFFNAFD